MKDWQVLSSIPLAYHRKRRIQRNAQVPVEALRQNRPDDQHRLALKTTVQNPIQQVILFSIFSFFQATQIPQIIVNQEKHLTRQL